ncbi:predicted protein [Histoplasma capsulatum H143]|uniref:Uncharacterized protein n=1 Tax=Ajellomyces capsulatus (strain H143) TaxID=544712 RepID=C6HDK9_AJECH|nr:predicted protein [Histoplasma capsulatum H143]
MSALRGPTPSLGATPVIYADKRPQKPGSGLRVELSEPGNPFIRGTPTSLSTRPAKKSTH